MPDDPKEIAAEEVRPYLRLSPSERYARFLDLMGFLESIWQSLPAEQRARSTQAIDGLDDPGRWWERVPV
jgi:hypothetical protein